MQRYTKLHLQDPKTIIGWKHDTKPMQLLALCDAQEGEILDLQLSSTLTATFNYNSPQIFPAWPSSCNARLIQCRKVTSNLLFCIIYANVVQYLCTYPLLSSFPDFILQPWRKIRIKSGSGLETRLILCIVHSHVMITHEHKTWTRTNHSHTNY